MPSESPHETPASRDTVDSSATNEDGSQVDNTEAGTQLPAKLSQFIKRLASFGLGEAPDPLLTDVRPQGKRRPPR